VNQERFTKWLLSASSGKNLPEESPVHAITPIQNTNKPVQTRNKDSRNEHILLLNWSEFRFLLAQAFESLERRLLRRVFLHDTLVGDLVHLFVVNGNSLQFDLDLVGQNVAGFVYQTGFSPEAETLRFDLVVDVVKMVGPELVYAFWRHSGFFATFVAPFLPVGFLLVGQSLRGWCQKWYNREEDSPGRWRRRRRGRDRGGVS
jgi:hypothetical protein